MASNELTLKIKQMRKPSFVVTVPADGSIEDLRQKIHEESDVEPNRQRLIHMGRVLKTDKRIADYDLKDNSTVHLIVRREPVAEPRNDEPAATHQHDHQHDHQHSVQGMAVLGVAAPEDFSLDQIMSGVLGNLGRGQNEGGTGSLISNMMQRARSGSQGALPNMIRIMSTTHEISDRLNSTEHMLHEECSQASESMDVDDEDAAARLENVADAILVDEAPVEADASTVEEKDGMEEQKEESIDDVVQLLSNVSQSLHNSPWRRYVDETIALLENHGSATNREELEQRIHTCGRIMAEYGTVLTSSGFALRRVRLGASSEEAIVEPFAPAAQIQVTTYSIQHNHQHQNGDQPPANATAAVDIEVDIDATNPPASTANNPPSNILDGLLQTIGQAPPAHVQEPAATTAVTAPATTSATAPANPMANLMQSVMQMMGGRGGANPNGSAPGGGNPFQMLSGLLQPNQQPQQVQQNPENHVLPEQLVTAVAAEILKHTEISAVAACQTGDWSVVRRLYTPLRTFLRENNILDVNNASRRSQVGRNLALGVSRLLVGSFAQDRRDILRTVTDMHFRCHMRRLVDILADSTSPESFEEAVLEWGNEALTSWIYKLSVNFTNGISGVRNCLSQIGIQWLGSLGVRGDRLHVVPEFVKHFVDGGYKIHVERLQEHGTQARLSSQDEWAYTLPPSERQRWLQTVRTDSRRAHGHALRNFSAGYAGTHESQDSHEDNPQSSGIREQRRSHFSPATPHPKKRRLNPKKDGEN